MFNRNKYTDDDFEDFRRYEEYQRRKDEAIVKGAGNFLYKIVIYWFMLFAIVPMIGVILQTYTNLNMLFILIIAVISYFFIIKIPYIKMYPFKSLAIIIFIDFLIMLAF